MGTKAKAAASSDTHASRDGFTSTRALLTYGVIAGPFYLALGIGQALLRDGFSFARHPLSVLANGQYGWIQTANFAITGLLVIGAAIGLRRVLGANARAMSWFLGAFGACMLLATIFRADPMDGFPVGTPVGPPTSISTFGLLHFVVGAVGFVALGISGLLAARTLSRHGSPSLSRFSLACGLIVIVGFFGGMAMAAKSPVIGIWIAVVVGWVWLLVLSRALLRDQD